MQLVADLHLHSRYSRAVSKRMTVGEIAAWAIKKGIGLVGTADWTHPLWLGELRRELRPVAEGLFALKGESEPLFLLATEISSIYSQGGRGRRIHNLVLVPSFEVAEKVNQELKKRGANLLSDGRPIIGLSARDLVDLVLTVDRSCLIIPCHVWTPWFSLYGSKSGFDSVRECFGEMSDYIYGIETGLSSDPAMNWRIEELEERSILSFSDAHSPAKLGREATVFKIKNSKLKIQNRNSKLKIDYRDIAGAIRQGPEAKWEIGYTVEFYPEEGKYHWTGHRKCNIKQSPEETKKTGATCPVCGRRLTVGVMHRVEELATDDEVVRKKRGKTGLSWMTTEDRPPYVMMVPLLEILAEVLGRGVGTKTVQEQYERLVNSLRSEFAVLLKTPVGEIAKLVGERTAEAIGKVREGDIFVDPGFDGEFGKVKIWGEGEKKTSGKKQMSLL